MAHCSLDNVSNAMPRGSTALASYLSGVYGASDDSFEDVIPAEVQHQFNY